MFNGIIQYGIRRGSESTPIPPHRWLWSFAFSKLTWEQGEVETFVRRASRGSRISRQFPWWCCLCLWGCERARNGELFRAVEGQKFLAHSTPINFNENVSGKVFLRSRQLNSGWCWSSDLVETLGSGEKSCYIVLKSQKLTFKWGGLGAFLSRTFGFEAWNLFWELFVDLRVGSLVSSNKSYPTEW